MNLPDEGTPEFQALIDQLDAKVQTGWGCWEWLGKPTSTGYGWFNRLRKQFRSHVLVYTLLVGPVPEGMILDHLCHTWDESCAGGDSCPHRICCNPSHLEPVTLGENVRRGRSISSVNREKTHGKCGHPLSGDNLVTLPNGERRCRICQKVKSRENSRKRRERLTDEERLKQNEYLKAYREKRTPEEVAKTKEYMREYHARRKAERDQTK